MMKSPVLARAALGASVPFLVAAPGICFVQPGGRRANVIQAVRPIGRTGAAKPAPQDPYRQNEG